jgi:hypothetical protein
MPGRGNLAEKIQRGPFLSIEERRSEYEILILQYFFQDGGAIQRTT